MDKYIPCLKLFAPVFFIVAGLHLFMGVNAEVSLGAKLSTSSLVDPVLDSQNRFYGVIFSIYGVLLLLCASDFQRYRPVFLCLLVVFFAGGIARLVSLSIVGIPSGLVLLLLASELLLPILAYSTLRKVENNPNHVDAEN